MSIDERLSRFVTHPGDLHQVSPEVLQATKDLFTITQLGSAALNLEREVYQLRQILRRRGEYDSDWKMYSVFSAPDSHVLVLQQPDEHLYNLERIDSGGNVDYSLSVRSASREKEYRDALAQDISGRPVFIGNSIKTDGQATGLWIYDEQRRIRAAFDSHSKISLLSEELSSHRLRT